MSHHWGHRSRSKTSSNRPTSDPPANMMKGSLYSPEQNTLHAPPKPQIGQNQAFCRSLGALQTRNLMNLPYGINKGRTATARSGDRQFGSIPPLLQPPQTPYTLRRSRARASPKWTRAAYSNFEQGYHPTFNPIRIAPWLLRVRCGLRQHNNSESSDWGMLKIRPLDYFNPEFGAPRVSRLANSRPAGRGLRCVR